MSTLVLEHDPQAVDVSVSADTLTANLADGRSMSVPLSWYARLMHASEVERANWHLLGDGYAIEWPDVDQHIGVEGLLAGRRSAESAASLKSWLSSRGAG